MDDIYFQKIIQANHTINKVRARIRALEAEPFGRLRNRKKILKLQATEEGGRDILNTSITASQSVSKVVDKNNYQTYSSMVTGAYDMYGGRTNYGNEFFRGVLEARVGFISGEGLSVVSENEATQAYVNKFLDLNKLHGSMLVRLTRIGELEGKALVILKKKKTEKGGYIRVNPFSWYKNNYTVSLDNGDINKITYTPKNEGGSKTINPEKSVFVRLGGSEYDVDTTPNRLHVVLTDFENASRAKYDLRKNSHIFGKIMPYWNTETQNEASAINKDVNAGNWEIGQGYAGTAGFSFVEPGGGAANVIIKDMLSALKAVSTSTGIPIHWMAWPELMSNRATAENLMELMNNATRAERIIWEEAYTEMIIKSMKMAIDEGFETNDILGEFEVKLPVGNITFIKSLIEVWAPLQQLDVISMATLRSIIPSIEAGKEKKAIEEEKEGAVDTNQAIQERLKEIDDTDDTDTNNR